MTEQERKKLLQYGPYAMLKQKNRLEALSSFGINTKNIKNIDETMHTISLNCKKNKNNDKNCVI